MGNEIVLLLYKYFVVVVLCMCVPNYNTYIPSPYVVLVW